jgi:poly-beta-1,6-N-acetyl-D-glucosamine synthase
MLPFYLFWISFAIVFYTYLGYAALVYLLAKRRGSTPPDDLAPPGVTLVIAAFNEEVFIEEKIRNIFALEYPSNKLEVIFVTDGSTDRTAEIISQHSRFRLFHESDRRGKIHAVNRVMPYVTTPVTVFCDANTLLNPESIKKLVRHYHDPNVGGVAGEKRIISGSHDNASGSGEGLYWKYESFLKRKDAEVHSVIGAAGELFSIRTELFEAPPEDMIIEDFYLSLRIVARGFRFEYEPEAYALEAPSVSAEEEWKRKVRICAGAFQAMPRLTYLLNPFRYGIISLQYFSHRVLRWTFAPLSLPVILFSNLILAASGIAFFQFVFAIQICFYAMAGVGYLYRNKPFGLKGVFVPYYFTLMNAAVYAGFWRHLNGKQSVLWERAKRAEFDVK